MNFCAYFDRNYLDRALVCRHTLLQHRPDAHFYTLCFDEESFAEMDALPSTTAIRLEEVEGYLPKLLQAKGNRQPKEYYATMSPILPRFLFDRFGLEKVFYTDADMMFFSDPAQIDEAFGDSSIMVSDHGFEPPRAGIRFNVGILGYRNDERCRRFLEWWSERCIEWCYWVTTKDGKMADQGYLNILHDEPDRFPGWLSCPHPGVNLGPWNGWRYSLSMSPEGQVLLDGKWPLVCYHYHEFRMLPDGRYHPTGWKLSKGALGWIYDPYAKLVAEAMNGGLR